MSVRQLTYAAVGVCGLGFQAQSRVMGDYRDVAVIVNLNSPTSVSIGAYFQSARGVPDANMIYVRTSTDEEIDSATFTNLRVQVEQYLALHGLADSLNYLVTTKGLPLKVNREPCRGQPYSVVSSSASVESDLALVLGPYASAIGMPGRVCSPYFNAGGHFSRKQYGIYLVTRLDGYSSQGVCAMIDRSGPGLIRDSGSSFVLDEDPVWNGVSGASSLNQYMADASSALRAEGIQVDLNTDTVYVTRQQGVAGYVSWGSNDHHAFQYTQNAIPYLNWAAGAIAETYVSTSARSFNNPPCYGQSLIADLLSEGASGAKGYVYEPFSTSMANASILFKQYTSGYNLAESYSLASPFLSWMDVVVGDPKTSYATALPLPIQLGSFSGEYDNTSGVIHLSWQTLSETNNYGFMVQRRLTGQTAFLDVSDSLIGGKGTSTNPTAYAWSGAAGSPGTYQYRLRQIDLDGAEHYSESVSITVNALAGVRPGNSLQRFDLAQNFPNPFNPSTTIRYSLPAAARVVLSVFNAAGELVAEPVQAMESAGTHDITFSAEHHGGTLPTGVYFYRLQAGEQVSVRRMIYLK